jgi:excisionase family DNA binding protein
LPLINPAIGAKYGLEMTTFIVENVSVPPEVEEAIDKRSSMAAVGNLNDYVKLQMAEGMAKGGGGGAGGFAAEMAVGMGMAQQMMQQPGGLLAQGTRPAVPPPIPGGAAAPTGAGSLPEMLSPADAAKALGVTEADMLTALADGSLKGKKIGAAWRITRTALEEFLRS